MEKTSYNRVFYAVSLLIGILLGAVWFLPLRERAFIGQNDFMQLYAGAKLVGTPDLYNIQEHWNIQKALFGDYVPSVCYTRLPFYALLLSPLGHLPYQLAYGIYQLISISIVCTFLYLYIRQYRDLFLIVCICLPLLINFANGQDAGMAAAFAGFAMLLMRRDRDFLAGLILSLGAIKIHLFVLVPLVLIVRGRWKVLQGGAVGGAVLLALSFVGGGLHWVDGFLGVIENPILHPGADHMPTYRTLVYNLTGAENHTIEFVLSGATALFLVYLARKIENFDVVFGLSLIAGILVCFHAYWQDLLMALTAFAIFSTTNSSKALRLSTLMVITPPACLMLLQGPPWSTCIPPIIMLVLVSALADAHASQSRAAAGLQTA